MNALAKIQLALLFISACLFGAGCDTVNSPYGTEDHTFDHLLGLKSESLYDEIQRESFEEQDRFFNPSAYQ